MEHRPRHLLFSRDALLQLYTTAPPAAAVADAVREHGLRAVCCLRRLHGNGRIGRPSSIADTTVFVSCYRGCRSGCYRRPPILKSSTLSPSPAGSYRHNKRRECSMNFGSLNIRSLANKVDHLLEVRFAHNINVLFLVKTWHDADFVCLRRLRADGLRVIGCPRP